ncbi:MAG TPA: SGNH/GDSL hydrolase family protein [Myxococcaceae bacterium]
MLKLKNLMWASALALSLNDTSTEAAQPEQTPDARAPLQQPIRYAALGASDTVGVGSRSPAKDNWTARLHAKLPPGTEYARFARSGILLEDAAEREVAQAIAFRPTLITLWLSVNDITHGVPLPRYRESLRAVLGRLTRETSAQVALLNVPDLSALPRGAASRAHLAALTAAWNDALASAAAEFPGRVLIVDLAAASRELSSHGEWLSADGFHPSAAGYQKLAEVTEAALRRAGLLPPVAPARD